MITPSTPHANKHVYGEKEREREYPNNALEAKGVPAETAAAAAEAAAVAENNP